jgi:hypothetical protein
VKSDRLVYELDFEPKVLLRAPEGEPGWYNLERFANKQRIRTGVGYRRSFAWRFEVLYIWTRSRNTIEEGCKTADNSIDIRLKRVF